jgi:hypothetical protein
MNKTITLITGAIITIALAVFLVLGKIDLTTFGTLTTAILGVVYGFHVKLENIELTEQHKTEERFLIKKASKATSEVCRLEAENSKMHFKVLDLERKNMIVEDNILETKKIKPKSVKKPKV